MFSQRKSFWKRPWFIVVLVAVIGAGYWFTQTDRFSTDTNSSRGEQVNQPVDSDIGTPDDGNRGEQDENPISEVTQPNAPGQENFYLVKEIDGTIEIYYYEGEGDPIFIKNADITFSLLSEGDQAMFSKGVIIETEEDLNELLQDFGS